MGVCNLPAFQTGQGPVVPFPHGTSSSEVVAGPRSLWHPGKLKELALALALPLLVPFTGSLPRAAVLHWWKSSGPGSLASPDRKVLSEDKHSTLKSFPMDASLWESFQQILPGFVASRTSFPLCLSQGDQKKKPPFWVLLPLKSWCSSFSSHFQIHQL